jgi:hypothetical protein
VPLVSAPLDGPALAGPAGAGRFLVEGASVAVTGVRRGAIESVWIAGREVVRDVRVEPGAVANVVAYPGLLRRERVGPSGTTTETVVAAPTVPLAAVQLASAAGLTVRFAFAAHAGAAPPRVEGGTVRADLGDGAEVVVAVSPSDSALRVVEGTRDGVEAEVRSATSGPLTLLIAAGPPDRVGKALSSGAHLEVHARAAAQARLDDGLTLVTGVSELDDGIHWARMRLTGAVERAGRGTTSDIFLAGLAAASVGDLEVARRAVQHTIARANGGSAGWDEAALLASHLAMVFGEAGPAARVARTRIEPTPDTDGVPGLDPAAAAALADALRHSAPAAMIEALRALGGARTSASTAATGDTGRRLPMAGRRDDRFQRLAALLAGMLRASPGSGGAQPGTEAAALEAAGLLRAEPDAGWARWRGRLSAGMESGPEGPGSWDHAHAATGEPVAGRTSGLLLALVHGLLGFAPDAPVGRVRVAPVLPSHLKALRVRGLPVGTSRISLVYARADGVHRFTLVPERGGVPPLVVFEPAVPGEVADVLVDGIRADLAPRRSEGRTVVPVQLPLDGPRTVEIVDRT